MEIIKYLCEFFFCDVCHFLALVVLFDSIHIIRIYKKKDKED